MKRILFVFFLFTGLYSFSQDVKKIEIILESGEVKTTDWIKLVETPTLQKPFLTIDNPTGLKIKIKDIKSYQGYDQDGYFRQLQKININQKGEFRFTESIYKTDSTDAIKIFYNENIFALELKTDKESHIQYQFNDNEIKKLDYKNIKQDFTQLGYSCKNLEKAKQIKIVQYASLAIATGLLGYYILDNKAPYQNNFMENNLALYAAGIFFVLPFTLEKPKKDKLIAALKNYK